MEEGARKEKKEGSITKKKEVKLGGGGEKHRHVPSTNRLVSEFSLKGKFCIVWATWYNVSGFLAKSLLQG